MRGISDTPVPTGTEPVTLAEAKAHLRIDYDTEDDLIGIYVSASRTHCEGVLGYCLIDQTRKTTFDCFAPYLTLIGPLESITSVKYRNSENVLTTVDPSKYTTTSGRTLRLYPATDEGWPVDVANSPGAVEVEYSALADVTDNVRTIILMKVTDFYENRHDTTRRYPTAADKMLALEREAFLG